MQKFTKIYRRRRTHAPGAICFKMIIRLRRRSKAKEPEDTQIRTGLRYSLMVAVMDIASCLIASILLVASVVALAWGRSMVVQTAIVAIFGVVFALLLKLMAGKIKRGEVFGATAAFYAVAVVFLVSMSKDCGCR